MGFNADAEQRAFDDEVKAVEEWWKVSSRRPLARIQHLVPCSPRRACDFAAANRSRRWSRAPTIGSPGFNTP